MAGKLLAIILAAALTGAALLALRHERIVTAHRMSKVLEELRRHERTLAELRRETSDQIRLDAVQRLRQRLEIPLRPLAIPESAAAPLPEPPAAPAPAPPRSIRTASHAPHAVTRHQPRNAQ